MLKRTFTGLLCAGVTLATVLGHEYGADVAPKQGWVFK